MSDWRIWVSLRGAPTTDACSLMQAGNRVLRRRDIAQRGAPSMFEPQMSQGSNCTLGLWTIRRNERQHGLQHSAPATNVSLFGIPFVAEG